MKFEIAELVEKFLTERQAFELKIEELLSQIDELSVQTQNLISKNSNLLE